MDEPCFNTLAIPTLCPFPLIRCACLAAQWRFTQPLDPDGHRPPLHVGLALDDWRALVGLPQVRGNGGLNAGESVLEHEERKSFRRRSVGGRCRVTIGPAVRGVGRSVARRLDHAVAPSARPGDTARIQTWELCPLKYLEDGTIAFKNARSENHSEFLTLPAPFLTSTTRE